MKTLWINFFRRYQKDPTLEILKSIPIFKSLTYQELEKLRTLFYERTYKKGEFIFREGQPGAGMFIIIEGEVEIKLERSGEVLAVLKTGDFFGEIALLLDIPRTATAQAKTFSKIYMFFKEDLLKLLQKTPKMGNKILLELSKVIAYRLMETNKYLEKSKI